MKHTRRQIAVTLLAALSLAAAGCDSGPTEPSQPRAEYSQTDIRVGTGDEAATGKRVSVNYTGWLYSPNAPDGKGNQFDTSIGKTPLNLTVGNREVITGFDRGVLGMKVGGARRVVIPPEQAYGSSGSGPIPPNATLVFEIELLSVQ